LTLFISYLFPKLSTASYSTDSASFNSRIISGSAVAGTISSSAQISNLGYAITGSNTFVGTQTMSGSIIPATDNTYDLGSATYQWKDIYVSSGSLYIDGTKVLGSTGTELQITTDVGQSIKILEAGSDSIILQSADGDIQLKSSGGGNLLFDPTSGLIDVRGTLQIQNGNKITSSDGNAIQFGNNIAITGSIISTTTPLVSGSSQIDLTQTTGFTAFSSSIATQFATIDGGTY
jgi:flagellar basal body rod protein FlgG